MYISILFAYFDRGSKTQRGHLLSRRQAAIRLLDVEITPGDLAGDGRQHTSAWLQQRVSGPMRTWPPT